MSSSPDVPLFSSRTRVVCFGSRLHGDDAFGCQVYDALVVESLPRGITVHDAGTAGLGGLIFFEGCERAIVVDAIRPCATPGRLRTLRIDEALSVARPLSTHAQGLGYLLQALPIALATMPVITIVGVEVESVDTFSEVMSAAVQRMVNPARDLVIGLLAS